MLSNMPVESRGTTVHLLKQGSKRIEQRAPRKRYTLLDPPDEVHSNLVVRSQAPVPKYFEPSQFQDVQAQVRSKQKR